MVAHGSQAAGTFDDCQAAQPKHIVTDKVLSQRVLHDLKSTLPQHLGHF